MTFGVIELSAGNARFPLRDSQNSRRLFKFQRGGVVGAINKLERFGNCILADSVGLGETFEALGIVKYHESRNYRVLVLCPKRLRDNWTLVPGRNYQSACRRF